MVGVPEWRLKVVGQWEELAKRLTYYRVRNERIVLTNGCFDILHAGHVRYLEQSRRLGDRLVVGVNTDESIARLKGNGRPINILDDRMCVLAGLASVDVVVPFGQQTASDLAAFVRPDTYVKAGDYIRETLPEAPIVEQYGGEVKIVPLLPGRSTSRIAARMTSGA